MQILSAYLNFAVIGEEETEKQVVTLKNMTTGEQTQMKVEDIIKEIR